LNGVCKHTATPSPDDDANHVLQAATNFLPAVQWSAIATDVADANGVFQFTDPQAQNFDRRFYRVAQ
jgi:hypothetical protein